MRTYRFGTLAGLAGLVCLGAGLIAPRPLAAQDAKGTFRFGKIQFRPVDALAYQQPGTEKATPVTMVVMADFPIDRPAVLEAIDTVNAMLQLAIKKENGNVIIVKAHAADRCGVVALLGGGEQQVTLSESFPAKTKTSTPSRVSGECFTDKPGKMFADVYEFRLSYDLSMTTIPPPVPLPAGGGQPGLALVALIKAIRTGDWKVARVHLREEEVPATPPAASEMKDYFRGLALNYPKTALATGGLMKGDRANVEISGTDNDGKKVKGTFGMKRVAGTWRVVEQSLFFAE
jgi:hypothetical protein